MGTFRNLLLRTSSRRFEIGVIGSLYSEPPVGAGAGTTAFFSWVNLEMAAMASLTKNPEHKTCKRAITLVSQSPMARSVVMLGVMK